MSSSVAKIAVAFVAGLVLALAGALVYVRMQDRQPPLVSQEVAPKEAASKIEQPASADTDPLPAKSVPSQPATPLPAHLHDSVAAHKSLPTHKSPMAPQKSFKPPPEPVQVVENKPAPALPLSAPL